MNLDQLKRSRAARHGIIDPIIDTLEQAIVNQDHTLVEETLAILLEKESALSEIVKQLEEATEVEQLPTEIIANEAYADTIIKVKVKAYRLLTRSFLPGHPAPAVGRNAIKLPKLQIPKFSGLVSDWQRFWDQFEAGIHKNTALSSIDKFNYLRGLLTDAASSTIKGLQLTDANYPIAIDLLLEKYGKTEILIAEHVKQLWNTKRVSKIDDGQEIRQLLEGFQTHLFALKALGKDVSAMGTLLGQVLLQSIPLQLVREWNRKTQGKHDDDLPMLLDFLRVEVEAIEQAWRAASARVESTKTNLSKETHEKKEKEVARSTTSSFVATNVDRQTPFCIFCEKTGHYSSSCASTMSHEAKIAALRKGRRCFRCLKKNHTGKQCSQIPSCKGCQGPHHGFMCFKKLKAGSGSVNSQETQPKSRTEETQPKARIEGAKTLVASTITQSKKNVKSVLQTIRVWIESPSGLIPVIVLVDGGSERSFVTQRVAQKLHVPIVKEEELTVYAFGGSQKTQQSRHIPLTLVGANGIKLSIEALEVQDICSEVKFWESSRIENLLRSQRIHGWNACMGSGETVSIDLLIGADWFWKVMSGHMKRLSPFLMATESIFGWMLQGSTLALTAQPKVVAMLSIGKTSEDTALESQVAAMWELDRSGTLAEEEKSHLSVQDVEVLENFEKSTVFKDGRYHVEIPWTEEKENLGINYNLAKERLRKLLFKLQQNPELLQRYQEGIYEYLGNKHSEEVEEEVENGSSCYYMPHHPVIKEERKTTKLRIVFDASSKENPFLSLNQCQFVGPNLNPNIFELLLRFRWHQIGFCSDIEKAFLQVSLKEQDRDATRFLWTDQKWDSGQTPQLKIFRMTRVLFGMRASPFLLAATIRLHLKQHPRSNPMIQHLIDRNIYIDDLLSGASNMKEAHFIAKEARDVMAEAGMQLKKWATNDASLRQKWAEEGLVSTEEPVEVVKILGLMWDAKEDELFFKTTAIMDAITDTPNTKRKILEIMARVYDPLGLIAPKVVLAKSLLQDLWRLKIGWDQEILEDLKTRWMEWKDDIQLLDQVSVPRRCSSLSDEEKLMQLHVFCDASPKAYGAAAYLKTETSDARISIQLIAAKSRIAPLQLVSIPRLELLACVIGVRLATTIFSAWEKQKIETYFWSDSKVAIEWIQQPPGKWKLFVGRRVQEVQSYKLPHQWNYCPTKDNPADALSRGQSLQKLMQNHNWWQGPKWLTEKQSNWPTNKPRIKEEVMQQIQEEEKKEAVISQVVQEKTALFDVSQFSSWRKIMRITCWIFRFVKKCRKKIEECSKSLTTQEMQEAENFWWKELQTEQFSEEKYNLKKEEPLSKTSSLLPFNPFFDEKGFIRLGGRLQFAAIPVNRQHPILLRGGGHLVKLFILDRHLKVLHGGVQSTLVKIRNDVWIIKGRQVVRKALKDCLVCRKWSAQPAQVIEAPLPAARLLETNPFQVTGLDFAGPAWVKVAGEAQKSYICIFTCAVTRAIHLELALSQNQHSFLLAFRRFVARRGLCKVVYSDNAKTYKQTDNLLKDTYKNLESREVQDQATKSGIQWRFIPPKSPWYGGFYERLVGSVKHHLRRQLGSALLGTEELTTILAEIEAILNCRPLGGTTEDPEDSEYLTPSHFLMGKADGALTDIAPELLAIPSQPNLLKRWKYRKQLMERFWRQWRNEYLLQLKTFHELKNPTKQDYVKIGDLVLVKEEKMPRSKWKMARITEVTVGRDGRIRSAMLKTTSGQQFRRAIQHICPLEIL